VHPQLLTRHKLFCRCPAGLYTEAHDGEVLRHMRPTLSELGEYDGTALMEFKTKKEIIYLLNHLNVCTYEMDDTPPFLVNQDAIDVSIELCLMMKMDIIDEVHIARKQYLDGSKAYAQSTANITPDYRAQQTAASLQLCEKRKLSSAGFLNDSTGFLAKLNSKGLEVYQRFTSLEYSVTVRTPDGTGSGYATADYNDITKFDAGRLT